METKTLIERLQKRAKDDRDCAINSQVMFDLLKSQLDAFDAREGFNTYVVRAAVDHRNALRRDTQYADDLDAAIAALSVQKQLVEALEGIAAYPDKKAKRRTKDGYPSEVVYDEFAYKRMVNSYRDAIRAAILAAKASS